MTGGQGLRLAVLISGRGSNMEAIAHACERGQLNARIERVIADRADAGGLAVAAGMRIPCAVVDRTLYPDRVQHEQAILEEIRRSGAQLIVLAGYMRILSPAFVSQHTGRLLNIHPSLLPAYKGLHTHQRVIDAGEREHGASVHFVTAQLDGGPVICQVRVTVQPDDSDERLAARVLAREHALYPFAIGLIAQGRLQWRDGQLWLDGDRLAAPLNFDDLPSP